ncbi:hypothetical protein [Actinoalloteichus hymeniacidonis]|uniref:Uncharacterized protein n=1 Tax=Actinoalloteichus hymeniacidonis TaxID=340345 RepID=A0AAC9HPZ7_9PSEU|nr:hypothetical protein [Actinoalloteichus hymeniacidonis]AOS63364.1 hypothetical protein TL08_12750 [Actinoalloteichus hymeniacidonis]MBB5908596.1 hypothetical protein [Actinoalloteichus hymeniacidonis]
MSATDRDSADVGESAAGRRPSRGARRWVPAALVVLAVAVGGYAAWPLLTGSDETTTRQDDADSPAVDSAATGEVSSCAAVEPDPADEFLAAICDPEFHAARRAALEAAAQDTGFSIGVRGDVPADGYMVSFDDAPGLTLEGELLADTDALESEVDEFLLTNRAFFAERTGSYLGGWINPDTEELVIGVSERYTDRAESLRVGADRDQIAVYDLGAGEDILVSEAAPAGN